MIGKAKTQQNAFTQFEREDEKRLNFYSQLKRQIDEKGFYDCYSQSDDHNEMSLTQFAEVLVDKYEFSDTESFRDFCKALSKSGKISLDKLKFKLGVKEKVLKIKNIKLDEYSEDLIEQLYNKYQSESSVSI